MEKIRIIISGLWIATMLIYLLGDVLRMYSGDMVAGMIGDKPASQGMWLGIAVMMTLPIAMLVLTLIIPMPHVRSLNLVIAVIVFAFNVIGLPYKGHYDNFLIVVSLMLNGMVFWYSWHWTA